MKNLVTYLRETSPDDWQPGEVVREAERLEQERDAARELAEGLAEFIDEVFPDGEPVEIPWRRS